MRFCDTWASKSAKRISWAGNTPQRTSLVFVSFECAAEYSIVESFFAVAAPGLESFTAQELRNLGLFAAESSSETPASPPVPAAGGVAFSGDLTALYRANLHLRTATRVLLRMGEFYVAAYSELRRKLRRLDWPRFIAPGQRVNIRVTCHKSKLSHSGDVADHVADAIAHRVGGPIDRHKTDDDEAGDAVRLIIVRIVRDQCSVSIDTSGAPLHQRGYRQAVAKAPLRETVAAALLMATAWDTRSPLLDPFCGSGVIPIEAALMAAGVAPGRNRHFAFMEWPDFDAECWRELVAQTPSSASAATLPSIIGSDRDAGAIRMAQENAARAGVAERIQFATHAVSAIQVSPGSGWVITNPPYGIRVSAGLDLRNLYAQFGEVLRTHCSGWRVGMLCSDRQLLAQTRLSLDTEIGFVTGGVRVWLGRGTV